MASEQANFEFIVRQVPSIIRFGSRLGAAGSLVQVADRVVRAAVLLVRAAHRVAAQRTAAEVAGGERAARLVLLARVLVVGAELARRHVAGDTRHTWHTRHRGHQPRLGVLRQPRQQQRVARAHAAAGLEVTAEA